MPRTPAKGMVSSRESGQRIHAQSYEPPPELAAIVERFWLGEWDLPADAPHTSQLLSDPSVHLVFEDSPRGYEARVVGVWTRLWERKLEGRGRVRGVKLHPGAAGAVLPAPLSDWTDQLTPLSELLGAKHQSLTDAVLTPHEPEDGFEALAAFLLPYARLSEEALLARRMVEEVKANASLTRVDAIAEHFSLHKRTVQRLFKEQVGASPKWLIRRFRLQEVATRIESGVSQPLAQLALDLGYSDQAHLTRDFRAATGKTPSAFEKQR